MSRDATSGGWRRLPGTCATVAGLFAGVFAGPGCAPPADDRPGIVILLADDQAARSLGAAGDPVLRTPQLDRVAAEGVRFTRAFATTSLCSPSRASFLTGRWARSHGLVRNVRPLPEGEVTLASALRRAGYDTAYVGKWHMGKQRTRPGFDHSASYVGQGVYDDCEFLVDGEARPTSGHVDDVATDFALDFLRRPRDRPFLLMLGFKGAHAPRLPPPRFDGLYRDQPIAWPGNLRARTPYPTRIEHAALADAAGVEPAAYQPPSNWAEEFDRETRDIPEERRSNVMRRYYRSLTAVDENVGRVLDALEGLGRAEDTIVVYASDNGMHLYAHGTSGKRSAYEESMRIVTLFRYPRLGIRGVEIDELVLNVDLAPTLLDLAGVAIPASMQGKSWRPLLEGRSEGWRTAFVYEHYRDPAKPTIPTLFALRTRDRKLVLYPAFPQWTQLFDLAADPLETRNLAFDPDRVDERSHLEARMVELERELGPRWKEPQTRP